MNFSDEPEYSPVVVVDVVFSACGHSGELALDEHALKDYPLRADGKRDSRWVNWCSDCIASGLHLPSQSQII